MCLMPAELSANAARSVEQLGYDLIVLDMSEFQKMDGGPQLSLASILTNVYPEDRNDDDHTYAIDFRNALSFAHTIATLAYRGGKAMRGAPESFSSFKIGDPPKTPGQILAHISDLLDWAITLCDGKQAWNNSTPQNWAQDTARFHENPFVASTTALLQGRISAESAAGLFQGPIADALTHVGQINMLRRLAGVPIRGGELSPSRNHCRSCRGGPGYRGAEGVHQPEPVAGSADLW